MKRFWIVTGLLALWGWGPSAQSVRGQCCGGSHAQHPQPQAPAWG
jgi:hypothetical protein